MDVLFVQAQLHGKSVRARERAKANERKRADRRQLQKELAEKKVRQVEIAKKREVIKIQHKGRTLLCRAKNSYMPYQKDGIARLVSDASVLLADEMGLGKTIQAIGLINSLDLHRVLIVCPASLKLNWLDELNKWLARFNGRKISVVHAANPKLDGTIWIINYEILDRFIPALEKQEWDLIVGDEAHRIKSPQALRTKAFLKLKAKRRLLLTGTPVLNRPQELWTLLHWLNPSQWPSFAQYEARYCMGGSSPDAPYRTSWDAHHDLHKAVKPVMLRRLKRDVLKELPRKFRQIIRLPCDDINALKEERDLLIKLEVEGRRLKEAVQQAKLLKNGTELQMALQQLREWNIARMGQISRVRHNTALLKVPYVVEQLSNIVEQTGKAICFAHHRDVAEKIRYAFPGRSVIFYGGMSANEKHKAAEDFQKDPETSLFVGGISSAGQGITLTASSTVVFAELDWTPANLTQCEDRAHRIGQQDNVLVQHLVIDGSIDSLMAGKIVEKQQIIDRVVDGGRVDDSQIDVEDLVKSYLSAPLI